ncbi:MAG: hypothetical protein P9X22_02395 [Candidatus Zapsychrus exili]|nr:hypothetical protein [Candidatus Zapsychrus exili]
MKRVIRSIIVIYGLVCLLLLFWMGHRGYYDALVNNSPYYNTNRDYTMALFFERWDEINSTYDPYYAKDNTPKWYDEIKKPLFFVAGSNKLNKSLQKLHAKEYIRQYVKGAVGIDHRKVEAWLLNIVVVVNAGVYTYEEIFLAPAKQYDLISSMHMNHLRQVLSFLPITEHLASMKTQLNLSLSVLPVLFGFPLFLIQLVLWIKNIILKKELSFIMLKRKVVVLFLYASTALAIAYFIYFFKIEWEKAAYTDFVSGKLLPLQVASFTGGISFLFTFLWLWSLTILYKLTKKEVVSTRNTLITRRKRSL